MLCLPVLLGCLFWGCKVKYSLTGASISPLAKTFSVSYFPNNAAMVAPSLSATLTDALQEKFVRQSRLQQVREGGDLHMEGEIVGYVSTYSAVSSTEGQEQASMMRLTITVKVRFTNAIEPQYNFDKSFSNYGEYGASRMLQEVEPSLIPEIVDMLVEDIYNAAVSNW
jgi:hypothetical protein